MMNNDVGQRQEPTTKSKSNMDTDTQDDKDDTAATVAAVVALQGATEVMQGVRDNLLLEVKEKQDHQDDDDDDINNDTN